MLLKTKYSIVCEIHTITVHSLLRVIILQIFIENYLNAHSTLGSGDKGWGEFIRSLLLTSVQSKETLFPNKKYATLYPVLP